ncbi:MAG TPA: hypothetical protein VL462_00695 [Candidatus Nitrosotalea sp.]|jgi:hypothetical protein|nr:hypothetical protein [Candidatus Nitrosotalea sp.]
MDIRPSRDARRRADRQMSIQVRVLNDKATEHFDLAHAQINHIATRYERLQQRARHVMAKS